MSDQQTFDLTLERIGGYRFTTDFHQEFGDFCIVTQSVRRGIDVQVAVEPVVGDPRTPAVGRRRG